MTNLTKVTLKHSTINSGAEVQVFCTKVNVSINKTNDKKPNANYSTDTVAQVQSLSVENPKYILSGVVLGVGDLTYSMLLDFFKLANDAVDPIYLTVVYGTSAALADPIADNFEDLIAYDGVTTDIPVTFDGALSIPFDTTATKYAYRPTFNISLIEVRETV